MDGLQRLLSAQDWDWGSVPDWIVAATAVITAWLVVNQLFGLRADRERADTNLKAQTEQFRSEAQTARANLLLRIDEQFEGGAVFRSRVRWTEMRSEFLRAHALADTETRTRDDYVNDNMVEQLNLLWDRLQIQTGAISGADVREYHLVTRLPNWIETLGMLVHESLTPLEDIVLLYGGVIRMTMEPIARHLEYRRRTYPHSKSFANALWLYDKL